MNKIAGKERNFPPWILITVLGLASFIFYFNSLPQQLTFPDAASYADVARSIYQGKGTVVSHYYPCWFNFIRPFSKWLNLEPLLHPLFIALNFSFFGISDKAVMYASALFFLLSIPLLYFLTKKIFSNQDIALLVTLIFIAEPLMLYYSTSGLSEPLFIFLSLATISLLYVARHKFNFFLSGVIFGLSLQARTQGLFWLPGVLTFVFLSQKKSRPLLKVGLFLLGMLVMPAVFQAIFGASCLQGVGFKKIFASLAFGTNTLPQETLMRSILPIGSDFMFMHWREIIFKFWQNLGFFFKQFAFPSLGNLDNPFYRPYYFASPIIIVLYLIGIFIRHPDPKQEALKISTLALILSNVIFCSLSIGEIRYLHPAMPLMLIFAVESIFFIFKSILSEPKFQKVALSLFVSFFILLPNVALTMDNYRNYAEKNHPWQYPVLSKALAEDTDPAEVVLTNLNVWGSWYSERKTIFIPLRIDDISTLEQFTRIDAVFLSSYPPPEEAWMKLIFSPAEFLGFKLVKENQMLLQEIESRRWFVAKTVLYKRK